MHEKGSYVISEKETCLTYDSEYGLQKDVREE